MNAVPKRNPKGKLLKFEILGEPKSKQSMRTAVAMKNGEPVAKLTKSGKKSFKIDTFQDKKTESNELWVKWNIVAQLPFGFKLFTGPIIIHKLHYIFSYTLKARKEYNKLLQTTDFRKMEPIYKTTKPDIPDNLNKMVFDAMEMVVYVNDSQVIGMDNLRKYYGEQPKIIIELEEL